MLLNIAVQHAAKEGYEILAMKPSAINMFGFGFLLRSALQFRLTDKSDHEKPLPFGARGFLLPYVPGNGGAIFRKCYYC